MSTEEGIKGSPLEKAGTVSSMRDEKERKYPRKEAVWNTGNTTQGY